MRKTRKTARCPKCGSARKVEKWTVGSDFQTPSDWYVCHRCKIAFAVNPDYYEDWLREEKKHHNKLIG